MQLDRRTWGEKEWLAFWLSEEVGPPTVWGWKCDPECKWANMRMLSYGDACADCWLKACKDAMQKQEAISW